MTDPVAGYVPASSSASVTGTALGATAKKSNTDMDQDTFLKLLVAQMKYQDPSKPMDPTQFMSQTAQFTSVEKLTTLATAQTSMLASQNFLSASSMVGRTVTYPGPDNSDVTGIVTSARFSTDGPVLRVGDVDVPLTSVKEVTATAPTA